MSSQPSHFKFTKTALLHLPRPKSKTVTYHDTEITGFKVTFSKMGVYTFMIYRKINGRPERVKIGNFPALTVYQARKGANAINTIIAQGGNPNEIKRGQSTEWTLQQLFQNYLDRHAKIHNKHWQNNESNYHKHLSHWNNRLLSHIRHQEIQRLHGRIGKSCGKFQANRIVSLLKVMFNKAILWNEYSSKNPVVGIKRYPERSRTRFLQESEIPKLFSALAEESNITLRDYVLMSLLTGARKSNVLAMRWEDIYINADQDKGEWLIPETKNGEPHTIPLVQQAIELLQQRQANKTNQFVFAGRGKTGHLVSPNKGWKRILKRANLANLRIHDLRRSLGSWQAEAGTSLVIIGKTLGHKNLNTTAIYAQVGLDPVRKSMQTAIEAMFKAAETKAKQQPSQRISINIETEIVEWFQSHSEYYQANINHALRFYINQHSKQS